MYIREGLGKVAPRLRREMTPCYCEPMHRRKSGPRRAWIRSCAVAACAGLSLSACSAPEFKALPGTGGSAGQGGTSSGGASGTGGSAGGASGGTAGTDGGVDAGGSGGSSGGDAGKQCPGPPGAASIDSTTLDFTGAPYTFPKENLERHIKITPPAAGHFTKAELTFELKFAAASIKSPTTAQRVIQLRNLGVPKSELSEDPGCFFGMLVNQNQAQLTMCGHAPGTQSDPISWKSEVWYQVSITYDTTAKAADLEIVDGGAKTIVSHKPGTTIYPIGQGLILHIGQSTNSPANTNLEGAKVRNLVVTLDPGTPWCDGYPFT